MPKRPQRDKKEPDAPRRAEAGTGKKPAEGTPRSKSGKSARKRRTPAPAPAVVVCEKQPPPARPDIEKPPVSPVLPAAPAAPITPAAAPPTEAPWPPEPPLDFELSGTPVLLEELLARHAEPVRAPRSWTGAVGVLAGLAVAWHWQGAAGLAAAHLNPAVNAHWPVQIALAWLAVGLAASAWAAARALREGPEPGTSGLPHTSVPLTSTLAGILIITSVMLLNPWREAHAALASQFFWTPLSLWVLDTAFVSLLFGPAWLLVGWLLGTMAARAEAGEGAPGESLPAWALLGVGSGLLLGSLLARVGLTGQRQLLLGALPLFTVAVLSARGSRHGAPAHASAGLSPHVGTGSLRLLVIGLVGSSAAIVLVLGGLRSCCGFQLGASQLAGGLTLLSLGAAMCLTHVLDARMHRYDCGMALLAAGLCCALAAVALAKWPGVRAAERLACLMVSVPPAIALALLLRAAAARSGGASPIAWPAAAALSGAALGAVFCEAWAGAALGAMGVWAAGALGLIACGSLVVIHEQERPTSICRLRLAAVFGGLSVAIALLPGTARQWTRHMRESRAAVDAQSPAWQPDERRHLLQSVCCIGVHPAGLERWPVGAMTRVEAMAFEQWAWAPPSSRLVQVAASPAGSCLRGSHQRYEVLYQRVNPAGAGSEQCTAEWLGLLADHVSPGGQLVLEAPASAFSPAGMALLADTFEHVVGPACSWTIIEHPAGPALVLQGWPGRATCPRGHEGRPLAQLQQARGSEPRVHSLLRGREGCFPPVSAF